MSAESLFVKLLRQDETIGALVQGRIYDTYTPEMIPANLYPCLVYTCISRDHVKSLSGNDGMYYPRYELALWSLRSSDLRTFASRLYDLEGPLSATDGNTSLLWLWVDDEIDAAEPAKQNDERAARSAAVDVTLWYSKVQ